MLQFDFQFEVPGKSRMRASGEFLAGLRLAILGPSGCGKSTFLKSLCALGPRTGEVSWGTKTLNQALLHEGILGFCFQSSPLFPHLSVKQNLLLPFKTLKSLRNFSDALAEEKVLKILEKAKIASLQDRWPHDLSGGEKKRISLLRAMVFNPPLLVLDEPFSDLDAENKTVYKSWIEDLIHDHKGILIYVTHSDEDLTLSNSQMRWPKGEHLDFGRIPR